MDCLKGKHYFEDNCKSLTDFYMSFIAGAACMDSALVLFQEMHKSAEVDSAGRSPVIWMSCGAF